MNEELYNLNQWLAKKYGVQPPFVFIRKEMLWNMDSHVEGYQVYGLPILIIKEDTRDPARVLAHEFHHYLSQEKGTLEKTVEDHEAMDKRAVADIADFMEKAE